MPVTALLVCLQSSSSAGGVQAEISRRPDRAAHDALVEKIKQADTAGEDIEKQIDILEPHCEASGDTLCGPGMRWNYAVALSQAGRSTDALVHLEQVARSEDGKQMSDEFRFNTFHLLAEVLLHEGRAQDARDLILGMARSRVVRERVGMGGQCLDILLHADMTLHGAPSEDFERLSKRWLRSAEQIKGGYVGWGATPRRAVANLSAVPSTAEFGRLVGARQPARLAPPGGLSALGIKHLSPAQLAQRAGDEPVVAEAARPEAGAPPLFGQHGPRNRRVRCSFSELLIDIFGADRANVRSPPETGCLSRLPRGQDDWRLYLNLFDEVEPASGARPYRRPAHRFKKELPIPPFLSRADVHEVSLWIGHGGAASALHNDGWDNLYIVLAGSKRFRIYPPDSANLGAALLHPPAHSISPSGMTTQERMPTAGGTFSLLRSALPTHGAHTPYPQQAAELRSRGYVVDLQVGEALYLPGRWLHEVSSASGEGEGHMAVNFWFAGGDDERAIRWNKSQTLSGTGHEEL